MSKILVTGSNGQVGQELQFLSTQFPHMNFTFVDLAGLDITDADAVSALFAVGQFDYCINCAAYTAVDKAETDQALATAVNVSGVEYLAAACKATNCQLIHLSTDYVYHNTCNRPLVETDEVNPQSVYASTKLAGDLAALRILPQSLVIRTSWVYSSFGHNFVKTMQRLGRERDALGVVFDQIGTPTYARDLAQGILEIIDHTKKKETPVAGGIYHYSNEGVCSWYDFALAIFELQNIDCQVKPIESREYPTPASRPPFSVLNKQKIKNTFDLAIPHWREGLKNCLEAIG